MSDVTGLEPPTNLTELRSFFWFYNVFRRLVPDFAFVASLINKKLEKRQPQTFDGLADEEITAFGTLKEKLIRPPV